MLHGYRHDDRIVFGGVETDGATPMFVPPASERRRFRCRVPCCVSPTSVGCRAVEAPSGGVRNHTPGLPARRLAVCEDGPVCREPVQWRRPAATTASRHAGSPRSTARPTEFRSRLLSHDAYCHICGDRSGWALFFAPCHGLEQGAVDQRPGPIDLVGALEALQQ